MSEQFEAKESSNVGWARYSADTQVLEIDFRDKHGKKASTYEYKYFPLAAWEVFQAAPSKGTHFAKAIRPAYKGVKIPAAGAATLPLE